MGFYEIWISYLEVMCWIPKKIFVYYINIQGIISAIDNALKLTGSQS